MRDGDFLPPPAPPFWGRIPPEPRRPGPETRVGQAFVKVLAFATGVMILLAFVVLALVVVAVSNTR